MIGNRTLRQLALRALRATLPRRRLMVQGRPDQRHVHLTFDDGPDPSTTPRILDTLGEAGAEATFFVLGRQVERHPELARRIVDEGHELGSHTYSHCDRRTSSRRELFDQLRRTDQVLRDVVGSTSRLFRPPFGKLAAGDLPRLWSRGRTIVLWNRDPRDYAAEDPDTLSDWFRAHPVQAGDCVLLHDTSLATAEALSDILVQLRDRELRLVPCEASLGRGWQLP